jgi:hypothetical protein
MISAAFDQPSRRGNSQVPPLSGTMPRLVKAAAIFAPVGHDPDVAAQRRVMP